MITLTIVLCNALGMCSTSSYPVEAGTGTHPAYACMMYGQRSAIEAVQAKEEKTHIKWYVRRWTCGGKPPENI